MEEKAIIEMTNDELRARIKELEQEKEALKLQLKNNKEVRKTIKDVCSNYDWMDYLSNEYGFTNGITFLVRYALFGEKKIYKYLNGEEEKRMLCKARTNKMSSSDYAMFISGVEKVAELLNEMRVKDDNCEPGIMYEHKYRHGGSFYDEEPWSTSETTIIS